MARRRLSPYLAQDVQPLVEHPAARGEVQPERVELLLEPAGRNANDHSAAGERVECGDRLRNAQGMPQRQQRHRRAKPDVPGDPRDVRERGELVHEGEPRRDEELAARVVGVRRRGAGRQDNVVRRPDRIESCGLGLLRHEPDGLRVLHAYRRQRNAVQCHAPSLRHSRARHGNPHDRRHADVRAPSRHSRARHGNPHDRRHTDGRPRPVILVLDTGTHTTVDTPTGAPIPSSPRAPLRHSRARPRSVILVLDTGTHTTVDTPTCAPIPSFPCAPLRHSRARPLSVILVLDTGTHTTVDTPTGAFGPSAPRHPPLPSMPLSPYHTCCSPVECPPPGTPRPGAAARPPDLRVNVAKCRRMSHFFIPPLGEWRTLRVKNLTFLTKTGPFGPVSVHSLRWRPAMVCRCGHSARALSCPRPGAATADVPKGARL